MFRPQSTVSRTVVGGVAAVALVALASCSSSSSSPNPSGSAAILPPPTPQGPAPTVTQDATIAAKVPAAIKNSGKLTIATDPNYPPMSFNASSPQGVDIDLANATAQVLGLQPQITSIPFDALINNVTSGTSNVGWAALTVTAEREQQADFVSYYSTGLAWLEKTGSSFNPDSPCGTTVAVGNRTSVMADATKNIKQKCQLAGALPISIVYANSQTQAAEMVLSGQATVTLADTPVIQSLVASSNGQLSQAGSSRASAPIGVAMSRNSGLGPVMQEAIQKLIDGGQYKQILDRWQIPAGAITKSELNPAP